MEESGYQEEIPTIVRRGAPGASKCTAIGVLCACGHSSVAQSIAPERRETKSVRQGLPSLAIPRFKFTCVEPVASVSCVWIAEPRTISPTY